MISGDEIGDETLPETHWKVPAGKWSEPTKYLSLPTLTLVDALTVCVELDTKG